MATKNKKNVKNDKINLEDPKKSATFAPELASDPQVTLDEFDNTVGLDAEFG